MPVPLSPNGEWMNKVFFNRATKEKCLLTNGKCVLDHSGKKAYEESHKGGQCLYEPSEAIVLRVVGFDKKSGRPIMAFTYIGVNPAELGDQCWEGEEKEFMDFIFARRSKYNIGRV